MQSLTATDWAVLEFLSRDPSPVGPLLASHPPPTKAAPSAGPVPRPSLRSQARGATAVSVFSN